MLTSVFKILLQFIAEINWASDSLLSLIPKKWRRPPKREEGLPEPEDLRRYLIGFVGSERMRHIVYASIRKPVGYALGVMCNLLTIADYAGDRMPGFFDSSQRSLDASCRDMLVLLGRFDRIVAKSLQDDIEKGNLNLQDDNEISQAIADRFKEMREKGIMDWLNESQDKIQRHLTILRGEISKSADGQEANLLSFLVHQALTGGPIGEIVDGEPPSSDDETEEGFFQA